MVRNHIKLFPVIESYYCRSKSNKQYLDGSVTLTKMYDLYKVTDENYVKENINRKVIKEKFNLSFFKPKKDRCDECEECKVLEEIITIRPLNNHQKKESKSCTSK